MLEPLLEQATDMVVGKTVVHELSPALAPDNVELAEGPKLVGNGGLAQSDELGEVRGAEVVPRESVHDPDPRRIPQDLERLREDLRLGDRQNPVGRGCHD